jgi:hypothetical protein
VKSSTSAYGQGLSESVDAPHGLARRTDAEPQELHLGLYSPAQDADPAEEARRSFEAGLPGRLKRTQAVAGHKIIPHHHFSAASAECVECFEAGNFYATITLTQALVESISQFVTQRRKLRTGSDFAVRIKRLKDSGAISAECRDAFLRVWGLRNDFHHLNPTVPTQLDDLERKALANIQDFALVESELFAFRLDQGTFTPEHPEYWDFDARREWVSVYLKIDS